MDEYAGHLPVISLACDWIERTLNGATFITFSNRFIMIASPFRIEDVKRSLNKKQQQQTHNTHRNDSEEDTYLEKTIWNKLSISISIWLLRVQNYCHEFNTHGARWVFPFKHKHFISFSNFLCFVSFVLWFSLFKFELQFNVDLEWFKQKMWAHFIQLHADNDKSDAQLCMSWLDDLIRPTHII